MNFARRNWVSDYVAAAYVFDLRRATEHLRAETIA